MSTRLILGDCLASMRSMQDNSVDAIVTDPPAGIAFMGKAWDGDKGGRRQWVAWLTEVLAEARRVIKPGGHALVWALPRTSHWTGWAAEDAGWEHRDVCHHAFWSGFPKGGSIGPRIDKMAGAEREVVGTRPGDPARFKAFKEQDGNERTTFGADLTAPATPEAAKWEGWHTHLKPAVEHWHLLRKPLAESSIARQVLATGTGALHVDACRFAQGDSAWPGPQEGADTSRPNGSTAIWGDDMPSGLGGGHPSGRYPANLIHFPKPSRAEKERGCEGITKTEDPNGVGNSGPRGGVVRRCPAHGEPIPSGSNTYKCGCSKVFDPDMPHRTAPMTGAEACGRKPGSKGLANPMAGANRTAGTVRNSHPTVKPVSLMRWLVRLVTPEGGTVLDCFMGSGTTGIAAKLEGFDFIGCELSPEYIDIARARIKHAAPGQEVEGGTDHEPEGAWQPGLFG